MKEKLKEAVSIVAMAAFFTFALFYVIFYLTNM